MFDLPTHLRRVVNPYVYVKELSKNGESLIYCTTWCYAVMDRIIPMGSADSISKQMGLGGSPVCGFLVLSKLSKLYCTVKSYDIPSQGGSKINISSNPNKVAEKLK